MFKELLGAEFAAYTTLSDTQLDQLESHYLALMRWNKRLNLTRILGLSDIVHFHYCESLFLARFLPPGEHRIVDIGSGAGFPGIPTAILRPECKVTLVESHQRKSVFLREVTRGLKNVQVVAKRAEDMTDPFDWAISRAVLPLDVLQLKIATSFALLIGGKDAATFEGARLQLPWGGDRVLFHVERDLKASGEVSRGTC